MIDESWLQEFLGKAADDKSIAFDIGANVGEWSIAMSQVFAGVVAIEPDPRAYSELAAAAPNNVATGRFAAAATSGILQFCMRESHLQSSLLIEHPIGAADQAAAPIIRHEPVVGVTLDQLLVVAASRFVGLELGFVKVDVEGAEGDVLAGATAPIFSRVKWLIEIHDREREVGLQLERLGYGDILIVKHPHKNAHPKHFWVYAEPRENADA